MDDFSLDPTVPHILKCPVCQRFTPHRFHLCTRCQERFGKIRGGYPPWLRFLARDNENWINQLYRQSRAEVLFADRDVSDIGDTDDFYGLPYAPYPDEDSNREYRRVNKIPEERRHA